MVNLNNIKKVHCIGIGGIGVSAAAKLMQFQGKIVSGSDICETEITKELEQLHIPILLKHRKENIAEDTDLVIFSPAVPENNPEQQRAKELGIPQLSYPEFLGELSKGKNTIAITGTNGKSTTTAICGLILGKAGLDPTVIVGSKVFGDPVSKWKGNVRIGGSDPPARLRDKTSKRAGLFVVEACEHQANMLHIDPNIIVLTNLEKDHLDYYRDLNHIITSFQEFIQKLPKDGALIINTDDPNLAKLKSQSKVITYGIENDADVQAKNIVTYPGGQEFDLVLRRSNLKCQKKEARPLRLCLKIPGIFNIYNVLAAITVAFHLGADIKSIKKAVEEFPGTWRRFEKVGILSIPKCPSTQVPKHPIIISDYAHHPTAVRSTLQAAKEFYPDRRIVAVFQPHHHNRTKKLFNEFVDGFDNADSIIISKIYDVAGREQDKDQDVTSQGLVRAIKKHLETKFPNKDQQVLYAKDLKQVKSLILQNIQPNDLILIMGAGDIDTVARELVK